MRPEDQKEAGRPRGVLARLQIAPGWIRSRDLVRHPPTRRVDISAAVPAVLAKTFRGGMQGRLP
jgi:hypothetical protein